MRYPSFTGDEPCTQAGTEVYYVEDDNVASWKLHSYVVKSLCSQCEMRGPCLEWALHHEIHGYWGGKSPEERKKIRKQKNISIKSPPYWDWVPRAGESA